MHFHDWWAGPMPLTGLIRNSLMACSQLGHLIMSAPPGDGSCGASILPREVAGTLAERRVYARAHVHERGRCGSSNAPDFSSCCWSEE